MAIDLRALLSVASCFRGQCGFSDYQLGKHWDHFGVAALAADSAQEDRGGCCAHAAQRLPDGGEAGVLEGGGLDVIEAYD